jgi:hypothetical protein
MYREMKRVTLGLVLGLAAGLASVLLMDFPDKRSALLGAFCDRFALGFLSANVTLPLPSAVSGIIVGLLVSVPSAIVTKAYVPIVVLGVVFGAICGWIAGRYA